MEEYPRKEKNALYETKMELHTQVFSLVNNYYSIHLQCGTILKHLYLDFTEKAIKSEIVNSRKCSQSTDECICWRRVHTLYNIQVKRVL